MVLDGRVSMLFTDIEGSTRLLARLGDTYAELLSNHHRIMRSAIAERAGFERGTEGDSFFVLFPTTADAVAAAVDAQRQLSATVWPSDAVVRVRMGIETGTVVRHDNDYVGIDVHRAARIASSAHGGQVVIGATARADMIAAGSEGIGFRDLGFHRLKDLDEPEHLFQLVLDDLPDITTPIKTLGGPSNLPRLPGELVGRAAEVAATRELLASGARLVTLTGTGGVGKTSLAIAVAGAVEHSYPHGVYFAALAGARTSAEAWTSIATALDARSDRPPEESVPSFLSDRRLLLVLDNLEQLPTAAAVIDALLTNPGCTVLATSRGPLHLRSENEIAVHALRLPADPGNSEAIAASPAVELFVREARRVRPTFALDAETAPGVVAICERLGGLPLAIELAAAQIRIYDVGSLATSLMSGLDLASKDADRPDRQRTLWSTVEWSLALLSDDDRSWFVNLGALAGGGSPETIAAMVEGGTIPAAMAAVEALVDAGLLTVDEGSSGLRVSMPAIVRDVAISKLRESGAFDQVRLRHAQHFSELAATACVELRGTKQTSWRDRLDLEEENIREALDWATTCDSARAAETALHLATSMGWYWYTRGRATEGRAHIRRAIDAAGSPDEAGRAEALHTLGVLDQQQGSNHDAVDAFRESLDIWERMGNGTGVARELNSLGVTAWSDGNSDEARRLLELSASEARRIGDEQRIAAARSNLGIVALTSGHIEEAIAASSDALTLDSTRDDLWAVSVDRCNLAVALAVAGRFEEAERHLLETAEPARGLGDTDLLVSVVEAFSVLVATTSPIDSLTLLSGAEAVRLAVGIPRSAPEHAFLLDTLRDSHAQLSTDDARAARDRGSEMTPQRLLDFGLGALGGGPVGTR